MKLLLQSAMIFFGTLMAAGLVALGAPRPGQMPGKPPAATRVAHSQPAVAGDAGGPASMRAAR